MNTPSKPILYNGYEISKSVTVINRIEKVFFTEIYTLSDGNFLYLFTNLKSADVRGGQDNLIKIAHQGLEYLGIITSQHSRST